MELGPLGKMALKLERDWVFSQRSFTVWMPFWDLA